MIQKYNKFIKEQLDGYAYEFDRQLWEAAEKSLAIRSFFKSANVEDDFSSITFLKYYIKGLDKAKFNNEHKLLYSLLEQMKSRVKIRMLIISENSKFSDSFRHSVRMIDKNNNIESVAQPRSSYQRGDLDILDIIFIDSSIRNPNIYEFIDMLQNRLVQIKGDAILTVVSNSFTRNRILELRNCGIKYFLSTSKTEKDLQQNIQDIIDSLDG